MDVPTKKSINIASTSSDSKNSIDSNKQVQYLKIVCTYEDKNEVYSSKVEQPLQAITIQESDEASFTELELGEDESTLSKKVHHTSTVQQKLPENN